MNVDGLAAIVALVISGSGFVGGVLWGAWKWAVKTAREDLLREQVDKTLTAKDAEIASKDELIAKQWALLDTFTRPVEK